MRSVNHALLPLVTGALLAVLLAGVAPLWAATLHLRDGGEVNCDRLWREGNKVLARVNDGTITFDKSEVNLSKTFPKGAPASGVKKPKKKPAKEPVAEQVIVIDPDADRRQEELLEEYNGYLERNYRPERSAPRPKYAKRAKRKY